MGTEARARLGLAGLLVVTLLAFEQLFGDGDYAGPALLGMLMAAGLAIGARRLGTSTAVTAVVSAGALLWYLTLVFQAADSFFGLPSPDALAGLRGQIMRAYRTSRIDYAPVPVREGYVILTVIAMWSAAALGEIATFRWKRPLVATVPVIALFSFVMIVGTQSGASLMVAVFLSALLVYWALESSHRLRSWGRWVTAWTGRDGTAPPSLTGSVARRMGASCVAAALIAPVLLPAIEDGLLSWRSGAGGGDGTGTGSGGREVDLLVDIKPQLIEQFDDQFFSVQADSTSYWRLASLVHFDGRTWEPESDEKEEAPDGQIQSGEQMPDPANVERVTQTFEISGLRGDELPAAVQPIEVSLPEDRRDDLRYDVETADLLLEDELDGELSYDVVSLVPKLTASGLRQAQPVYADQSYTELPEADISAEVRALAERWTAGAETPFDKLVAIQERLRGFDYEIQAIEGNASADYLTDFLTRIRAGYCQQFATAFAVLARLLDYPTRVSVGFLPGNVSTTEEGTFNVTGNQAHAWPEVYFEGFGWVRFEPTPRDLAAAPAYTVPESGGAGPGVGAQSSAGAGPDGLPLPDADRLGGRTRGDIEGFAPRERSAERQPVWKDAFARLLTLVIVAVIVFLLAVPALKEWRTRRRYRRARDPVELARAAFAHFQDEAAQLVAPRPTAESAIAYAVRLAQLKKVPRQEALRLAALYEAAEYARAGVSAGQAGEARRLARDLRTRLWKRASWWERLVRVFSPAPLLGRVSAP